MDITDGFLFKKGFYSCLSKIKNNFEKKVNCQIRTRDSWPTKTGDFDHWTTKQLRKKRVVFEYEQILNLQSSSIKKKNIYRSSTCLDSGCL